MIGCEALEPLHLKGKELEAKYYSIFSPAEGEAEPPAVPECVVLLERMGASRQNLRPVPGT